MNFIKNIGLLFLFNCLSNIAFSQELIFNVQFFDQSDGLSGRAILSVNQDNRGFIWVGTNNGLNRFDGQQFRTIGSQNSKTATGVILGIEKSNDGTFWIEKGGEKVFNFDPYQEKIIPILNEEQLGFLNLLSRDKHHKSVWLRNEKGTIFYYDEHKGVIPFSDYKFHIEDEVQSTSWGTIILNEKSSGKKVELNQHSDTLRVFQEVSPFVNFFDVGKRQLKFSINEEYHHKSFNEIIYEIKEKGKPTPLVFKKGNRFLTFKDLGMPGVIHMRCLQDHQGNYWLIARNKVWLFDQRGNLKKELLQELQNTQGDTWDVNDALIDDHNRLWIATGVGLYMIEMKENPFQLYLNEEKNTSVRGITSISYSTLLVAGSKATQIIDIHSGEILKEYKKSGLGLTKGKDGVIWIGRFGPELIEINTRKDMFLVKKIEELENQPLFLPFFDSVSQQLLLGTRKGLLVGEVEHPSSFKDIAFNGYEDLKYTSIFDFYSNEEGVWIATANGLYLLDRTKGIVAHVNFPHNNIKHLHEDKNGDFWLATNGGGLIHWDRKRNVKNQITVKDGLSHNVIYAVYEDSKGYFWMPSNNGLMRFERNSGEVIIFQTEDGIANTEFNTFAHYQADDGRLYFGGLAGVTAFYPDQLEPKQNDAPFIVTQLQQFDSEVEKIVDKTNEFRVSNVINLNADDRFLIIDFALLDYSGQRHLYAWKIEGLDKEWTYQTKNSIRINTLGYGKYTLQIKGKGGGGQWAEQQLSIPLYVRKPFYLTWGFIATTVLAIVLITFIYLRLRFIRLQNVQKELKKQVAERTRELSEKNKELAASNYTKDKLFVIIGHDLRGSAFSLQDIGRNISYLIEKKQIQRLIDYGNSVDQSVFHLTTLLDNLLNWANQNLKTTTLKPVKLNLYQLVDHIVRKRKLALDKKNIQPNIQISSSIEIYSDEQAVRTIMRNLLSNAIKFTPNGGEIILAASEEDKHVFLKIIDNGVGIEKHRQEHIFDVKKNKSTRGTNGEPGTGLGLYVSKDLAVLNGGDIVVESILGKGSIFTVVLPIIK